MTNTTSNRNTADSALAIRNDYEELLRLYDPQVVSIHPIRSGPGEALHLLVTVHAPSHYLEDAEDTHPKPCSSMTVHIAAYMGYPVKGVDAWYESDRYLASPNVFKSGWACIDDWIPYKSSLISVTEKLVKDMIHCPDVTNYGSRANLSDAITEWHKAGVAKGAFPTIPLARLYKQEPILPAAAASATPPPLPVRRR